MSIYEFLCQLEEEKRVEVLGCDTWGVRHLEEIELAAAAELPEMCPAELGASLLGDDRGCEAPEHNKRICKVCAKRFLDLDITRQMAKRIQTLR